MRAKAIDSREALRIFCRQVRERSQENRAGLGLLHRAGHEALAIGILRQELDSMCRVMFLLSIRDGERRDSFIEDAVMGRMWKLPTKGRITDQEMVELAGKLHGWAGSVYRFGCAFLHLSSFHDYHARDPLDLISKQERRDLLQHLRDYHGGPGLSEETFMGVVSLLPQVFEKVSDNLECYVKELEKSGHLTEQVD